MKRMFIRRKSSDDGRSTAHTKSSGSVGSATHLDVPPQTTQQQHPIVKNKQLPKVGLTRDAFRRNLEDPNFLHKYGRWLANKCSAELLLFWIAAEHHRQELVRVHALARKIGAEVMPLMSAVVDAEETEKAQARCKTLLETPDPFADAREQAFEQLFTDFYPRFLHDRIQLLRQQDFPASGYCTPGGSLDTTSASASHAASWIVAAPDRDSRQCVMMASERMLSVTGRADLCGLPWTVLQGDHQDEASRRIRRACENNQPGQELLLSFKADGTPFHHLLRSIPLIGRRNTLDGFLFLSWDVTSLVNPRTDLEALLSDDLDVGPAEDGGFLNAELAAMTSEAVHARLKRQEARHLPPSISEAAAASESVEPVKNQTLEVLRQIALRPPTSGTGIPASSNTPLPDDLMARQDAIADEAAQPFLILDKSGEHITHADAGLAPYFVSGVSFAPAAERATTGLASRVRQAARKGQPVVMSARFELPGGARETMFSLVPLLDSSGRPAALCLLFLR